ncbi:hypothetical protein AKJ16_DCAP06761, partial [Drosera capensis]
MSRRILELVDSSDAGIPSPSGQLRLVWTYTNTVTEIRLPTATLIKVEMDPTATALYLPEYASEMIAPGNAAKLLVPFSVLTIFVAVLLLMLKTLVTLFMLWK